MPKHVKIFTMTEELSYVLITPYSLKKSRTGGIISRLLSRTGLDLVGGRMFAPGDELVSAYAAGIPADPDPRHRATQELLREYVMREFSPLSDGARRRVLLLVFRGIDAVKKTRDAVGHIVHQRTMGETIRDTYGDYITDEAGEIRYFEPAALTPPDAATAQRDLRLWAKFSSIDGGILKSVVSYPEGANVQETLVLIKPDNFRFPNARPGGVIDLFSRAGMNIVGFKVHRMSVAQAEAFYGPVLEVLQEIYKEQTGIRARLACERELGFPLTEGLQKELGSLLGPIAGAAHWESLIQFMAGRRPSECPAKSKDEPGSEKCVAIIYQGPDAVDKIRAVLGPTDPSKAPPGSIRREFGQSVMINAAHASDSADNAAREMQILRIEDDSCASAIREFYQA